MKKINKILTIPLCCTVASVSTSLVTSCNKSSQQAPTKTDWVNAFNYLDFSNKDAHYTLDFSLSYAQTSTTKPFILYAKGAMLCDGTNKRIDLEIHQSSKTIYGTAWISRVGNIDYLYLSNDDGTADYQLLPAKFIWFQGDDADITIETVVKLVIYLFPNLLSNMFIYDSNTKLSTWNILDTDYLKCNASLGFNDDNSKINKLAAYMYFNAGASQSMEGSVDAKITYDTPTVIMPIDECIHDHGCMINTINGTHEITLTSDCSSSYTTQGTLNITNSDLNTFDTITLSGTDTPQFTNDTFICLDNNFLTSGVDYKFDSDSKVIKFTTPIRKDENLQIGWFLDRSPSSQFTFTLSLAE